MSAQSSDALYSERIVWGPSYPLAAVLAVVGATQLFNRWIVGAILLGAAALVAWFCVARYTVTRQGVDVRVGLGRPHLHVGAADIASVEPTRVSMLTGWGYRGSWTVLRNVAIPLRRQRCRSDHDTSRQTTSTGEPPSQRSPGRGSILDRIAPRLRPSRAPASDPQIETRSVREYEVPLPGPNPSGPPLLVSEISCRLSGGRTHRDGATGCGAAVPLWQRVFGAAAENRIGAVMADGGNMGRWSQQRPLGRWRPRLARIGAWAERGRRDRSSAVEPARGAPRAV